MQLFASRKKLRLTPLTPKDIIVAQLSSRHLPDRTEEYRLVVSHKSHPLAQSGSNPTEAPLRPRTQTQMLRYIRLESMDIPQQFHKEASEEERLTKEFASLDVNFDPDTDLHKMVLRIKKRVQLYEEKETKAVEALQKLYTSYHSITVEGKISVHKASSSSDVLYQSILQTRKTYNNLRNLLVDKSLKIGACVRKSKNLQSVVGIVQIWKESFVSKIRYFSESNIFEMDVDEILVTMDQVSSSFKAESKKYKSYDCFDKLEQFVKRRKKEVLINVDQSFTSRILHFHQKRYPRILQNYRSLVKQQKLKDNTCNLEYLLEDNLKSIMKGALGGEYSHSALEGLGSKEYLNFFEELIVGLLKYCRNWHLVTRWHLEYTNEDNKEEQELVNNQGHEQLRFRRAIFQKIEERVGGVIGKSYTFHKLTLTQRGILLLRIYGLIREISLFAREVPKSLGEVIRKKCREERQVLAKGYDCWLKQLVTGELRASVFEAFPETRPFDSGEIQVFSEEELTILQQLQNNELLIDLESSEEYVVNTSYRPLLPVHQLVFPQLPSYSSALLVCKFTREISKRLYFNPRISQQLFRSLKEMLELQILSLYFSCCPVSIRNQLQQNWGTFYGLRFAKYDDIETNMPKLEYYSSCLSLQSEYDQLWKQIPELFRRFPINENASVVSPNTELKGQLLENTSTALGWIRQNTHLVFVQVPKNQLEQFNQELGSLGLLLKELVSLGYQSSVEDTRGKYESLASSVKQLKWEIKKYNNETSEQFKGYKNNYFGVFESQILPLRALAIPAEMKRVIEASLANDFFRALTQAYSKVEKINANGRQLMRLDTLQLEEKVKELGITAEPSGLKQLIRWIEFGFQSQPSKLQSSIKLAIQAYPFRIWKSFLSSCKASDEISWGQRREMLLRLSQHYLNVVSSRR